MASYHRLRGPLATVHGMSLAGKVVFLRLIVIDRNGVSGETPEKVSPKNLCKSI